MSDISSEYSDGDTEEESIWSDFDEESFKIQEVDCITTDV